MPAFKKAVLRRLISFITLLGLLGLALPASAQSTPSLQGVWLGTRTETGTLGSLPATSLQTFTFYQTSPGSSVVGAITVYWPGTTYYWSGSASGTLSGSTLSLTFTPEIVNLPAGNTACGETESLPITTSGGVTTAAMPSYHPCGSSASTITAYNLTLAGWQHLGCSPCGSGPQSGIPIDATTGNVTDTESDYTTSGMNPLSFSRTYNSLAPQLTYATSMGTQWRTNYDRYLQIISSSVVVAERPGGDQVTFNLVSGVWTAGTDVDMTLTNSGTTWVLTGHDDSVETYTASGAKATLNSIALRNGYTQTLTYTSGLLTSVTDSYSRTLGFTYTSGLLTQVTTPDSLVLTYGYTGSLLTSVGYNTSPATSQTYVYANASFPNALTSITDENGNTYKTFAYDTYGRSTSTQMSGTSAATTMTYTDATAKREETNPVSQNTYETTATLGGGTYARIVGMQRVGAGSIPNATSGYGYDSNGYTASTTDFNGNVTTYTNNAHGDPTTIVEASGTAIARTTTIAYDTTWVHLPATITTPGVTATFTYDTHGNPLTVTLTDTTTQTVPYSTNGQTRTWTYTYDATGHVLTAKTPNLNTTTFVYDTSGRMTSATNALSQAITVTSLTAGGLPLTVVDANGVTTTYTYSTRNWQLTKDVDSTGGAYTTTNTYDAAGNVTKVQQPDGSYMMNTYDNSHRLTKTADSFGNSINYTLDALGNATTTAYKDPTPTTMRTTTAFFDALGRRTDYVGGMAQDSFWGYDSNNNVKQFEDPLSKSYTYTIDALNRVSKNTLPTASSFINYTYDAHDRPLTVADANGLTTTYVYDGFGDKIQQTSPDTGTTVYHYDSDGNLTSKTDALSIVTNYTYDALDRVLTVAYPAHTAENVAYTYDQTGTGFAYGIGRLTSMTDAAGSLTDTYDTRGNLVTEIRTSGTATLATTYGYDAASRVLTITYPDGSLATYTRDAMGRVTGLSDKPSGAGSATTIASSITYAPFGPAKSITYGNGIAETITLDADYRTTQIVDNGSGSTHIQNISYALNKDDQPTSYTDSLNSSNSIASISYDGMSRMTEFFNTSPPIFPGYDHNGNRNYYGNSSGTVGITNITLNSGTNQFKQLFTGTSGTTLFNTLTTNANGNVTAFSPGYGSAGVTGLAYNNANQLTSVSSSSGTLGSYVYDGFGQRFSKTVSTTTTMFKYGQSGMLLHETNGTSATNYLYLNGKPITMLTGSTFTWLHDDHLGTPQVATNASQGIIRSGSYIPFGEPISSSGTATVNLRMPGQYNDAESGFSHNGYRNYVPSLGRYLEADPLGIYDFGQGEGINPYNYAGQDPMRKIDPTGLSYAPINMPTQSKTVNYCTLGGGNDNTGWYWWKPTASGTNYKVGKYNPLNPSSPPPECEQNDGMQVAENCMAETTDDFGPNHCAGLGESQSPPVKETDPGMVGSCAVCIGGGCLSTTVNEANAYMGAGYGYPGASCSLCATNNMQAFSSGWTTSGGLKKGAIGGNSDSLAACIQLPPGFGIARTYSTPVSELAKPYPKSDW